MTFDVEIECRVLGRSATNAGPSLPPRPPRCCCGFAAAAEPRYLCASVGVMNKCQTSSPSELDPCARVRREGGGEWRYELVQTKIYYNNVEPTRRGGERERDGVVVGLAPRGVGDIAERAAARRWLAPSSLTHWQRPSCRASASGRPSERRRRKRAVKRGGELSGQLRQCAKELVIVDNAVLCFRPPAPASRISVEVERVRLRQS